MVDVKSLLELMAALNHVYNGERFQLCGLSARKIIVSIQNLFLSFPIYDLENNNKLRDLELKTCQETA